MTSGMPFHDDEITFVKENMREYPSILARSLSLYYPQHNGGSRCTKSVSRLMNKIRTGRAPNSPDTPEDEVIEPNTLMRDLPAVAEIPKPAVVPVPVTVVEPLPPAPVAEIGTREATPLPDVTPAAPVTTTPAAVPKVSVKKIGSKKKSRKK